MRVEISGWVVVPYDESPEIEIEPFGFEAGPWTYNATKENALAWLEDQEDGRFLVVRRNEE